MKFLMINYIYPWTDKTGFPEASTGEYRCYSCHLLVLISLLITAMASASAIRADVGPECSKHGITLSMLLAVATSSATASLPE